MPTSRVSRRVDAGASNQSAHSQVMPVHLDLKSIAKCKAHRGEALVGGPRLTPLRLMLTLVTQRHVESLPLPSGKEHGSRGIYIRHGRGTRGVPRRGKP